MNLIDTYLNNRENWAEHLPVGQGRLLAVNASPGEAQHYQLKGWTVRVLAFSVGLQTQWNQDSTVIQQNPFQFDPTQIADLFDAVVWNDTSALFQQIPKLYEKVFSLIKPQGLAYLMVRNRDCIKPYLRASGREMLRWPNHSPCEYGLSASTFENNILWPGYSALQVSEIMDPAYDKALQHGHQRITGYDSAYHLTSPAHNHKVQFIRGWHVVLQNNLNLTRQMPVLDASMPRPQDTPDQPPEHAQIQHHLERMEYLPAQELLRKLFYSGRSTAETYNLQGIWHFLQEQPTLAWENFKLALEKDPSNLDYSHNLVDANKQCKKDDATRQLLAKYQHIHPEIKELLAHV